MTAFASNPAVNGAQARADSMRASVTDSLNAIRSAPDVATGDAMMEAWDKSLAHNANRLTYLTHLLSAAFSAGNPKPNSGEQADDFAKRDPWKRNSYVQDMREYAWRVQYVTAYEQAVQIWNNARFAFLAAAQEYALQATEAVVEAVNVTQDQVQDLAVGLENTNDAVEIIARNTPMSDAEKDEVAAKLNAARESITKVRESRVLVVRALGEAITKIADARSSLKGKQPGEASGGVGVLGLALLAAGIYMAAK